MERIRILFERYAFREAAGSALAGEFGVMPPDSPEVFVEAEFQQAGSSRPGARLRVDAASPELAAAVERELCEGWGGTGPRLPADLRIVCAEPFLNRKGAIDDTPGFAEAALLTAGAWLARKSGMAPGYEIRFSDRCNLPAPAIAALTGGFWDPAEAAPGSYNAESSVACRGGALSVWLEAPEERAGVYLQWFSQVSFDVQKALRVWIPYLALREPEALRDREWAEALAFYASTRPYLARVRGIFTWDVIAADQMLSVIRSASSTLPVWMGRMQRCLAGSEQEALAGEWAPSASRQVAARIRRDPRKLKSLLALEGKLVEGLLKFAELARQTGQTDGAPRGLHRECGKWARLMQSRLRHVAGRRDLPQLTALILAEATASLARAMGRRCEMRRTLRLSGGPLQPGEFYCFSA
jgi:hypothetical protein